MMRLLKKAYPAVDQPWYANDAGAGAKFGQIRAYFERLQEEGPKFGYFPEPSKIILNVKEHNQEAAEAYFIDLGFTIVTGSRYLIGFIGKDPTGEPGFKRRHQTGCQLFMSS
jgi:hypothetical protein